MTPLNPAAAPDATLDALVAAAAGRCLGARADTIAPDIPLSLLGLDSLAAVELAAELESVLGHPVPDNLLEDCTDLRGVASRLRELQRQEPGVTTDPFDRMFADAVLPADVRPHQVTGSTTSLRDARRILLTGPTGFLGSWLARELLLTTGATLYCLVRPRGGRSARQRLAATLEGRGAGAGILAASRIQLVEADLSRPRLGLRNADYDALARNVDAICHAGAAVNWAYSYEGVRSTNVLGTLELLRLACHRGALPFHFVSSLSVCYSTTGERQVDETLDPLRELRGVHLGYAQSKAVADALVLEAGRRMLPVRIYRPGLIAGDSRTGAFNRDDLLSTLVRGCVEMGTAPDLDWTLDCQPVDWIASAIVHLSAAEGPVFHIAHRRPRHWRECVLWMRLYGYQIRLVPYHAWLRQLDIATSSSVPHPLHALRSFFLDRRPGTRGLTLPELYEEGRRALAMHARTDRALGAMQSECPSLDPALLETYFKAFVAGGALAPPRSAWEPEEAETFHDEGMGTATADSLPEVPGGGIPGLSACGPLTPLRAADSIIGELASWRSRRPTGLFRARMTVSPGSHPRDAIVKLKALDQDAIAAGEALAHLCDPAVGEMYSRWRDYVGLTGSHVRELAIYGQADPRFVRHAPKVFAIASDAASGTWLVALERIDDAVLMASGCRRAAWDQRAIAAAIDGLAALQAVWLGREEELRSQDWIGHVPSAISMGEMQGLWTALAAHASPAFSSWAGPVGAIQRRLIARIPEWWPRLEHSPRTLIHNDFNPRNICLRGSNGHVRLCAYDWELATVCAPQRDLAEFLCFVLPRDVSRDEVARWIAHHRRALEREAGVRLDAREWREGFSAALYDLLINRLGMYALIHRVRRQAFLPDVLRTWRRLYELHPLEGTR